MGLTAEARAEASRNHTVMDVSWLLRSVEAGRELPTQARDFLFKGTKHARLGAQHGLMETDCYRDEMFEVRRGRG